MLPRQTWSNAPKPQFGECRLRKRAGSEPGNEKPCGTPGGTCTQVPASTRISRSPSVSPISPSSTYSDSTWRSCTCRGDDAAPGSPLASAIPISYVRKHHAAVQLLAAADDRRGRRAATVRGRLLLVVGERAAVAHRAQVVREAQPGRMQVEVAQLLVPRVPEAVHHERRHARDHPRRHDRGLALGAQQHGQLAGEDVEEVRVMAMDVQVRAVAARPEPRPGRVQRLVVGEDLDAPIGRVADDLAAAGRDDGRLAHARSLR